MPSSAKQEDIEAAAVELEKHVDRIGLAYVVEVLARICREKEEHIMTNWQDVKLAGDWGHDADKLSRICDNLFNQ